MNKLILILVIFSISGGCSQFCHRPGSQVVDLSKSNYALVPPSYLEKCANSNVSIQESYQKEGRTEELDMGQGANLHSIPGMNVARTSISQINASSVNGPRQLDNVFYGIQNAFDDGQHWYNGINYTYWLTDPGDLQPFVNIYFSEPVEVFAIIAETQTSFAAILYNSKEEEIHTATVRNYIDFGKETKNIMRIRLNFFRANDNIQVNEIKIIGKILSSSGWEIEQPKVMMK